MELGELMPLPPEAEKNLVAILAGIIASREAKEIHRLAGQYRSIALEYLEPGVNDNTISKRYRILSDCMQQHQLVNEIYDYHNPRAA